MLTSIQVSPEYSELKSRRVRKVKKVKRGRDEVEYVQFSSFLPYKLCITVTLFTKQHICRQIPSNTLSDFI